MALRQPVSRELSERQTAVQRGRGRTPDPGLRSGLTYERIDVPAQSVEVVHSAASCLLRASAGEGFSWQGLSTGLADAPSAFARLAAIHRSLGGAELTPRTAT
jgi:hypothetical protein